MSDGTIEGTAAEPTLRTLADKVNWLIDQARPAGRGPLTNAEVAALIERATGEQASHTTVWKLRNGQAANPQMKLLAALARTFGVHPGFFFDDFDENQAGLLQEQVELLALVRDASVSSTQLRVFLELSPEARRAIIDLIVAVTAPDETPRHGAEGETLAHSSYRIRQSDDHHGRRDDQRDGPV
jgi:ESX-1-secreted protein regulator